MFKKCLPILVLIIANTLSAPVAAATFNNVSGVVIEGGAPIARNAPRTGLVIGDFDPNLGAPLLNVVGNTSIFGGVNHRFAGSFTDPWSIDFGTGVYNAVFNWSKTSRNFDGQFLLNGVSILLGTGGSLNLGNLTGLNTFEVDPTFGIFTPSRLRAGRNGTFEDATWDFQATLVEPVPLPAGIVLMLSGLAGFAYIRRRQTV